MEIRTVQGADAAHFTDELAQLRISVFREFPYLYEGDVAYEREYLQTYLQARCHALILALDAGRVVGVSTCIGLEEEPPGLTRPFTEAGHTLAEWMYFGESVLLAPYRGRGVGVRFFEERERFALSNPGIRYATFCAVQRPADHPLRPAGYVPLDAFWGHRGYAPMPGVQAQMSWKEVGQQQETPHLMQFWFRKLQ